MKLFRERFKVFQYLSPYVKSLKKYVMIFTLIQGVLLIIALVTPLLIRVLVDDVMVNKEIKFLPWICIGLFVSFVLESIFLLLKNNCDNRILNRLKHTLRLAIVSNILAMKYQEYEGKPIADIKKCVNEDTTVAAQFINKHILLQAYRWVKLVFYVSMLFLFNWKLALIAISLTPISFLITGWQGKKLRALQVEMFNKYAFLENWLYRTFKSWKESRVMVQERKMKKVYHRIWADICRFHYRINMYSFFNVLIVDVKNFIITKNLLFFIGVALILYGEVTVGGLLVFIQYYQVFFNEIGLVNAANIQLHRDLPAIDRVIKMLELETNQDDKKVLQEKKNDYSFVLSNVNFIYPGSDINVLKDVNLSIKNGERVAIVGKSGSGKSTLIKLMLALYKAQSGEILFKGNDIENIEKQKFHSQIGVVMQNSTIFNVSLRENLMLADDTADDERILKACEKANILNFVNSLPDGLNTIMGEGGSKMSGGQKQRVAITRVMLAEPDVFIFDEATSSLDHESERIINETIDNLDKNKTVIIIAHRRSTILSANRVILVDDGQIMGEGTHNELLKNNKIYKQLFETDELIQSK